MISVPELVLERVAGVVGAGEGLAALAVRAAKAAAEGVGPIVGVVAATFSNPQRFPALAVRVASELGLDADAPALDVQLACSAYPYALYVAGRLSADLGGRVLVVDGDVQLPLVDAADHATGSIFSDAATASVVSSPSSSARSSFGFLSRYDTALECAAAGPIRMDGFRVFSFVATEVTRFLRTFGTDVDLFVPHQAQPYMVRQLARSLGLSDRLVVLDERYRNPGSCSVPLALAAASVPLAGRRALLAGFGAGYSAAACTVRLAETFSAVGEGL